MVSSLKNSNNAKCDFFLTTFIKNYRYDLLLSFRTWQFSLLNGITEGRNIHNKRKSDSFKSDSLIFGDLCTTLPASLIH